MVNVPKSDDLWNPFPSDTGEQPHRARARRVAVVESEGFPKPAAEFDHCRRKHDRVTGPFDGYRVGLLETPISIYDLSLGGCFVHCLHEQQEGSLIVLKIDLPQEGWITTKAETLYSRPGFGFAVRFVDLDKATEARVERSILTLKRRPARH